jgi:phytoene dehydrogenase-like protein
LISASCAGWRLERRSKLSKMLTVTVLSEPPRIRVGRLSVLLLSGTEILPVCRPRHRPRGKIGLPMPMKNLAARHWDVVVIGAGHNGLACATYLARAGRRVLVLESGERVGGACTIEQPFPGVRMDPCAYLAGLLHPLALKSLACQAVASNGRPGTRQPHHFGQTNAPLTKAEWKDGYAAARAGRLPKQLWCELYFQSAHDTSVAPAGFHTMSVFAQYVLRPPCDQSVASAATSRTPS